MTNLDIQSAYFGLDPVDAIYLGTDVVWQPASSGGGDVVYIDDSGVTHTDRYPSGIIPYAAYQNRYDIVSVNIGSGITRIGNTDGSYVFASCYNLSAVTIGPDVEYIGGRAFEGTQNLKNVTIPASVTEIGTNAFYNFDSSCTIVFEGVLPSLSMQEDGDLGFGTNIIVPDGYLSNYCSHLHYYDLNVVSDQGNNCSGPGPGPEPVDSMFWEPLTFVIEDTGTASTTYISFRLTGITRDNFYDYAQNIYFTLNGGERQLVDMRGGWQQASAGNITIQFVSGLSQGDVIRLYGDGNQQGAYGFGTGDTNGPYHFFGNSSGLKVKVCGNIKSMLVHPDDWINMVQNQDKAAIDNIALADRAFMYFFKGKIGFTFNEDATYHLILPDCNLSTRCFADMFNGCTRMTAAPELPSTALTEMCYYHMFSGCTRLVTPPELPATTLAPGCYRSMFQYCTALTDSPVLHAPVVATSAYSYMFGYCRSLTGVTCLAEDISANNSTYSWLLSVNRSGTFTKSPNMTGWTSGVDGIPTGWTVQDYVAPNP